MIDTGAGVIDADYRGKVHVLLFNLCDKDYEGAFAYMRGRKGKLMGAAVAEDRKSVV